MGAARALATARAMAVSEAQEGRLDFIGHGATETAALKQFIRHCILRNPFQRRTERTGDEPRLPLASASIGLASVRSAEVIEEGFINLVRPHLLHA